MRRVTPSPPSKPATVYVTARLALSPGGAVELAHALGAMLKTLKEMQEKAAAKTNGKKSS